jgi:peptidoglycan/LPS O-acetylase OafA/YrhL
MPTTPYDTRGRQAASERRLAFADGLRGLAASWVVLFHLSKSGQVDALRAWLPAAVDTALFDWGHAGVAMFFVLSGFAMALTVERVRMDGASAGRFMLRRLIRVGPPYWLAVAVFAAMARARGGELHAGQVLAHLLFLQDVLEVAQINGVFWTLGIEIQFYLAFAALTWLSDTLAVRRGPRLAVAVLALAWPLGLATTSLWRGGFLYLWVFFMAGVLVQEARRDRGWPRSFAVAFACGLLAISGFRHDLYSGVAGCSCLALIAADGGAGMQRWLTGSALKGLGRVSYSLYLFHTAAIAVVGHFWRPPPADDIAAGLMRGIVAAGCSVGLAWLAWWAIERPSIAWSHRWSAPSGERRATGARADGVRQAP